MECFTPRRSRKFKLPPVVVNFMEVEDFGAPKFDIHMTRCTIPRVPIDFGSRVNLMVEDIAFHLGMVDFEPMPTTLRMVDMRRVKIVGRLVGIPMLIGGVDCLLSYIVICIEATKLFSILLGRPWLYTTKVKVDWGRGEFIFKTPLVMVPWKQMEYQGETNSNLDYTSKWTVKEDNKMIVLCRDIWEYHGRGLWVCGSY